MLLDWPPEVGAVDKLAQILLPSRIAAKQLCFGLVDELQDQHVPLDLLYAGFVPLLIAHKLCITVFQVLDHFCFVFNFVGKFET